jgi:hypothetical protein
MAKNTQEVEEVEVTPTTIRPEDLAEELEVSGKAIRQWLRSNFTRSKEEKGTSWNLTEEMAAKVREHFTPSEDESDESEDEIDELEA